MSEQEPTKDQINDSLPKESSSHERKQNELVDDVWDITSDSNNDVMSNPNLVEEQKTHINDDHDTAWDNVLNMHEKQRKKEDSLIDSNKKSSSSSKVPSTVTTKVVPKQQHGTLKSNKITGKKSKPYDDENDYDYDKQYDDRYDKYYE